jgi:two-component system cell cycle sensor histidine kinase/response regulator CckA
MSIDTPEKGVILVVDDTPTNLEVLFDLLGNSGFKVLIAENGESAIEKANYALPDLILLDIIMPGMDGFEACRRLKANDVTQSIPVLFITALNESTDKVKGFHLGAVDFITKPFQCEEVLARVETHVRLQHLTQQLRSQNTRLEQEIQDRRQIEAERLALLEREQAARSEAEAARKRSTNILESITDAFFAVDHEWRFSYLNHQAEELLQRTGDALLGQILWDEFPVAIGSTFYREYHRAVAEQVSVTFEAFYAPLNTWFEVHAYPSEEGLSVYFQDITDRKRSEQKIQEQVALLNVATDAIFVRDLDHQILFWNQGAERIYGWQAAEAIGKKTTELLYGEAPAQLEQALNTTLETGEWQGELHQLTKSKQKIILESRWTLVRDEAEHPKFILTVNTDITEKKQLEAQFLRAQRLESIGTLASGIAHDLNNILTPILAAAQLLPLKYPNADDRTQQLFRILEANAKRGADLIKQVLSFARGVEGRRTLLQVSYLLTEIEQITKRTFPKSIEVRTEIPTSNLWLVSADATHLHQVLMNLCVNARDAMPNGGTLSISAENRYVDESYARMYPDAQVGSYVMLTIADTGVGIPREILDRIFDPFFTTKEVGKGTGLGLSTVIGIIKNHGGFISVYSEVGEGTQFKVYLPTAEGAVAQPTEAKECVSGRGELILVVDDEPFIQEITKISLEDHHYRVLVASDGFEAIALYASHQQDIRLVLLDLMMPGMDGLATLRILQKMNPQVNIIATSGLVSHTKMTELTDLGVTLFLPKPYTTQELLSNLDKIFGEYPNAEFGGQGSDPSVNSALGQPDQGEHQNESRS